MGIPIETVKSLGLRVDLYGVLCSVCPDGSLVPYSPSTEPAIVVDEPVEPAIVDEPVEPAIVVDELVEPSIVDEPRLTDWRQVYSDLNWRGVKDLVEDLETRSGEKFDRGSRPWGEAIDDLIAWEQLLLEQGLI